MPRLNVFIDGASKGNPGPSGIGVVIKDDSKTIRTLANYIGEATNNIAEYTALVYALQECLILGADELSICTDSELLYRQLKKVYKIKSSNLISLYNQAERLISGFKEVSIKHIPRELNTEADHLATLAVKKELETKSKIKG